MDILFLFIIFYLSLSTCLLHYKDDARCDKSKMPPNTFIEKCCPSLPHYHNQQNFINCNQTCTTWIINEHLAGARKCCLLNCTLVNAKVLRKYGEFLPENMIEQIKLNLTETNKQKWQSIIESVVNKCSKIAGEYNAFDIEDMTPQCETDNITLTLNTTHCIRREMFFACKDELMETKNCKSLVEYGRECMYWPWQCTHKRRHSGLMKPSRN